MKSKALGHIKTIKLSQHVSTCRVSMCSYSYSHLVEVHYTDNLLWWHRGGPTIMHFRWSNYYALKPHLASSPVEVISMWARLSCREWENCACIKFPRIWTSSLHQLW